MFATISTLLFVPVVFAGIHRRLAARRAARITGIDPHQEGTPSHV
jgi:hypothetical protein